MIQARTEDEHRDKLIAFLATVRNGIGLMLRPPESVPAGVRFLLDEESMKRVHIGMDMIVEAVTQGRLEKPGVSASRSDDMFQQWLAETTSPSARE